MTMKMTTPTAIGVSAAVAKPLNNIVTVMVMVVVMAIVMVMVWYDIV